MKLVACILSGGKGERFWPLSRDSNPKQFLRITGGKMLIEETYERVKRIPDLAEVIFASNEKFGDRLRTLFPDATLILEPVPKNTAPACGVVNEYALRKYGEVIIGVFPADHYIESVDNFYEDITHGIDWAKKGHIVTLGIKPDRVETGYGHIEIGERVSHKAFKVLRFHEKPDFETAKQYLDSGRFFWNAGMFLWRTDVFDYALKKHLPEFYEILKREDISNLSSLYEKTPNISVDYAIMEKERNIIVVEASFKWEDLGSFPSLKKVLQTDSKGNLSLGSVVCEECANSIFIGNGPLVVVYGLNDIIVVSTEDVVLVIPVKEAQNIKKLREALKKGKMDHLL